MKSTFVVLLAGLVVLACFTGQKIIQLGRPEAGPSPPPRDSSAHLPVDTDDIGQLRSSVRRPPHQPAVRAQSLNGSNESPVERRYLSGGNLNIDTLQSLLFGNDFSQEIQKLQSQMRGNPGALELSLFYRSAIDKQLRQIDGGRPISEFTCGLSICMGTIRSSGDDQWYSRWWNDFATSPETPHQIAFDSVHDLGGGSLEHRFVFSNDPAISAGQGKGRR